jgi:hypothetical protein
MSLPLKTEGAGNAGCANAPAALRADKKARKQVTAGTPETSGIPRAAGFNGFLRSLPGEPGFMSPSPAEISADLIPASGYQDATTSPSATDTFVRCAIASTASPAQRLVTIAKRPSCGQKTRGEVPVICPTSQAKLPAAHWHDGQIRWRAGNSVKSSDAIRPPWLLPDRPRQTPARYETPASRTATCR